MKRKRTTKAVIHCAATPDGMYISRKRIDRWHRHNDNISARDDEDREAFNPELTHYAYHDHIHPDGSHEKGRAIDEKGCHCAGENHCSISIVLDGTRKFTPAQWSTLARVVQEYQDELGVTVHGHNEFSDKECPCFDVQAWLKNGKKPIEGQILRR